VELVNLRVEESPESPDRVRLLGDVVYDTGATTPETYWFDYPAAVAHGLSTTGNAWLACLLPLAVTLGEPLRVPAPVSARLLAGARDVMGIWTSWYPHLQEVDLAVETREAHPASASSQGAFFSGGVDSFFTALRLCEDRVDPDSGNPAGSVDLITVFGFDVPLHRTEVVERLCRRHREVADALGARFVDVRTNLRHTRWREADWELLAHGPGLAGIGLGLEGRYRSLRIAATGGYRDLHPWASHPLVDPCLSTEALEMVHHGAAFRRVDKMRRLVASELTSWALRVCWRSGTDENCGECNKCYRTMLILELLGALERSRTFSATSVDLRRAGRVYCERPWDYREFRDIRELAHQVDRPDIALAATRAMKGSRRLTGCLRALRSLPRSEAGGWTRRLEEWLLRDWIR